MRGGWKARDGGSYGGGGGYDWRQHTQASDDPNVQDVCRKLCERVLRAEPGLAPHQLQQIQQIHNITGHANPIELIHPQNVIK